MTIWRRRIEKKMLNEIQKLEPNTRKTEFFFYFLLLSSSNFAFVVVFCFALEKKVRNNDGQAYERVTTVFNEMHSSSSFFSRSFCFGIFCARVLPFCADVLIFTDNFSSSVLVTCLCVQRHDIGCSSRESFSWCGRERNWEKFLFSVTILLSISNDWNGHRLIRLVIR